MQHNLLHRYDVLLRVNDVEHIQSVSDPGAEVEGNFGLRDVLVVHILAEAVADAHGVTAQNGHIAVVDGYLRAGRVGVHQERIFLRGLHGGNECVDDERIGGANRNAYGVVNGFGNRNRIVNGKSAGVEGVELLHFFGCKGAVPYANVVEETIECFQIIKCVCST